MPITRNTTKGFARNVLKNLNFIIKERAAGEDVHEVTQLVTSLLGLIVFPWEDGALKYIESLQLKLLEKEGWPRWNILMDKRGDTKTLEQLNRHLRNAISHRRVRFSSDDREMNNVEIEFEDGPKRGAPNWRATINAADLKQFCDHFTKKLEGLVA